MTLLIIELNWFVAIQPDNQIPYFWEDFSSLIYQLQRVLVVDPVSNFLDAIFVDFVIPAVEQIQGNLRGQVVLRTSRVFLNVKLKPRSRTFGGIGTVFKFQKVLSSTVT